MHLNLYHSRGRSSWDLTLGRDIWCVNGWCWYEFSDELVSSVSSLFLPLDILALVSLPEMYPQRMVIIIGETIVDSPIIIHIVLLCLTSPSSTCSGQYRWSNTPLKKPTGSLARNRGAELKADKKEEDSQMYVSRIHVKEEELTPPTHHHLPM